MKEYISAFGVFKGKKKDTSPKINRDKTARGSMRKASSLPVMAREEKKAKGILKVFKGGSFRKTIRGRPSQTKLGEKLGDSPYVAGDTGMVKLTGLTTDAAQTPTTSHRKTNTSSSSQEKVKKPTPKGSKQKNVNGHNTSPAVVKKGNNLPPKSAPVDTPKTGKKGKKPSTPPVKSTVKPKSPKQLKPLPAPPQEKKVPKNSHKRGLEEDEDSQGASNSKRLKSDSKSVLSVLPTVREKQSTLPMMNHIFDSTVEATKVFECMIRPVVPEQFFKDIWQKKPLLVKRHVPDYNDGWFSTKELDRILKKESILFGVNLDVTTYTDGKRQTLNPPGRAYAPVVWDYYQNGCSVRLLNPQTYSDSVWKLLSTVQEYFSCCVGANIYLTPPGTQGFAPHYDDIEAFILQLEGKKHWRLYSPRTEEETLPRTSSGNFSEDDIGEPILDVTLQAGDMLYFPRGTIHQAEALEDAHSLHITVSCYQKNTWGDLFEKLLPRALDIALEEDIEFREGLPREFLSYMGIANSDLDTAERKEFLKKVSSCFKKLDKFYAPVDAVCDQMGKSFIWDSLPPVLSEDEKTCSVHGAGDYWDADNKQVKGTIELEPDTCVKLIRKGSIRLAAEEETVRVYHNLENARVYRGNEPQCIEIAAELAPAVEFLIHSYPEYVPVDSIPLPTVEERTEIASLLYDKGLLLTMEVLQPITDEESSTSSDMENGDVD